ncbi:MAG: hypothetical protein JXB88_19165 [Spirochaetales bacterium]|nr:hypothetical protein [Spirochaetales bacterium]
MKQYIFFAFILLFFIIFLSPVQAAGQKEDKLEQAKELFNQKKYNDALILISQVIEEDPEKVEEAVKLSNKIMAIMELFNKKYEELITTLYEEQDVEKGRDLIEEIKEIYPEPNIEIQNSISYAEEGANLVVNLNLFEEIMEEALKQLSSREFILAVKTYISGFSRVPPRDLHRNEYESAQFGTIVETDLDQAYTALLTLSNSFMSIGQEITTKTDEILTAVSFLDQEHDVPSPLNILDNCITINEYRDSIKDAALLIKSRNDTLKERIEAKNTILYLKYTYQIVMGRDSSGETEGILYALNTLIDMLNTGIKDTYVKEAGIFLEQGKSKYNSREYSKAEFSLKCSFEIINFVLPVAYFLDLRQKPPSDYSLQTTGNWIIGDSFRYFMDVQERAKEILAYLYFIKNLPDVFSFQELSETSEIPTEKQYNNLEIALQEYKEIISTLSDDWESYIQERSEKTSLDFDTTRAESILALCTGKASAIVNQKFTYLSRMYNEVEEMYEQEKDMLENGIEHEQYHIVYYPDERVKNFIKLGHALSFISGKLQKIKDEWEDMKEVDPGFNGIMDDATILYEKTDSLGNKIKEQRRIAENNILQASKFKGLADLRNDEARKADRVNDFRRALSKADEAIAAYNESLMFQEDSEARRKKDQIEKFKNDVEEKENRLMISEVRKLVEEGRDYYTKGFYEQAYSTFLRALQRWEEIKDEENTEILDWLAYAQSAYEIESGRTINETDPLYKEMSQLYNLAKEDYNEGIRLKKAGENDRAQVKFKDASTKLLPILAQFPHNKDARLLDLFIRKETGEDFEKTFKEQMDKARNKLSSTKEDKLDAYYDLKDLETIDPNYRGLRALITEFEYALGIKLKPPTAAEKKRSKELTAQAKPYVVNRQFEYFPLAKQLLREALRLDPDNREAKDLFDDMGLLAD